MDHFEIQFVPCLDNAEIARASFDQHQFPMHFHDTYVIQMVDHGSDQFDCAGHRYTARPGDIVVIRPNSIHSGSPACQQRLKYRAIYPGHELIEQMSDSDDCPISLDQGVFRTDRRLLERFNKAFDQLARTPNGRARKSFGDLIRSLADLGDRHSSPSDPSVSPGIGKGLNYFHQHFDRSISLQELADICSLNHFQLIRFFRREIGMTPHQYMINFRILIAKRWLQTSGKNLSQIALEAGFADQSHMNRMFRRYFGTTPGRYRMNYRASLLQ